MARDHALAEALGPERAVLRLYRWERPTLSFGRNEPARDLYDGDAVRAAVLELVRRPTGGRAVLHHRELTYAVVVPLRALGRARDVYGLVNRALSQGLARLGVPVALSDTRSVAPLDSGPCFQEPAPGEVMAGGRKLVGSAQVRIGDALLQHGSILLEDDQTRVGELLREKKDGEGEAGDSSPATLAEFLPELPAVGVVEQAVVRGFEVTLPGRWSTDAARAGGEGGGAPPNPPARLLERYRSPEWTWRR